MLDVSHYLFFQSLSGFLTIVFDLGHKPLTADLPAAPGRGGDRSGILLSGYYSLTSQGFAAVTFWVLIGAFT